MSQLSRNISTTQRDHFNMEVGLRLAEMRKAKGLTGPQLAEQTGLSRKSISAAESGAGLSLIALALVADALDVTLDDLVPISSLERPWEKAG